jgi:hypothetical protein
MTAGFIKGNAATRPFHPPQGDVIPSASEEPRRVRRVLSASSLLVRVCYKANRSVLKSITILVTKPFRCGHSLLKNVKVLIVAKKKRTDICKNKRKVVLLPLL